MRPDEIVIDLVHRNNGRIIYLQSPNHLLPLPDAAVHPLKDVIQALLQGYIGRMLTGLMMVVEFFLERALVGLQAICNHDARFLVACLLGLPEHFLSILSLASLGYHADQMKPGLLINDVPKLAPFATDFGPHLLGVPEISPSSGSNVAT